MIDFVLVGGPQDGKVLEWDRPPHDWRISIPPTFSLAEPDDLSLHLRIGIYKPRLDASYHHSRNDAGQLVYEWQGERDW